MSKGDIDIFQLFDEKTFTIKYCGLSLLDKIGLSLAILGNKKIVFNAKGKVNIINLSKQKLIKKMETTK